MSLLLGQSLGTLSSSSELPVSSTTFENKYNLQLWSIDNQGEIVPAFPSTLVTGKDLLLQEFLIQLFTSLGTSRVRKEDGSSFVVLLRNNFSVSVQPIFSIVKTETLKKINRYYSSTGISFIGFDLSEAKTDDETVVTLQFRFSDNTTRTLIIRLASEN